MKIFNVSMWYFLSISYKGKSESDGTISDFYRVLRLGSPHFLVPQLQSSSVLKQPNPAFFAKQAPPLLNVQATQVGVSQQRLAHSSLETSYVPATASSPSQMVVLLTVEQSAVTTTDSAELLIEMNYLLRVESRPQSTLWTSVLNSVLPTERSTFPGRVPVRTRRRHWAVRSVSWSSASIVLYAIPKSSHHPPVPCPLLLVFWLGVNCHCSWFLIMTIRRMIRI